MMNALKIFKLTPIDNELQSHHWEASTHKCSLIIRCADEKRARKIATMACVIAVEVKSIAQEVALCPWQLPNLVSCQELLTPEYMGSEEAIVEPKALDNEWR